MKNSSLFVILGGIMLAPHLSVAFGVGMGVTWSVVAIWFAARGE
jgi:hypothetical protein